MANTRAMDRSGLLAIELITSDISQFAKLLRAYKECSPEIQAVVEEMSAVIADPASSNEDIEHACDTLVEALMPGLTAEIADSYRKLLESADAAASEKELLAEEKAFANRVRKTMKARGITQEQLAERIGVSQPAISNILNRKSRPQRKTISRIAEALEVTPEQLWPGSNIP